MRYTLIRPILINCQHNFVFGLVLLCSVIHLIACDLNHDWQTTQLMSYRDIQPNVLHRMLEKTLANFPGRLMIIDIKDLYKMKGQINAEGDSLGESRRSTAEVVTLEHQLMQSTYSSLGVIYYSQSTYGFSTSQLYDPEVLAELATKAQVNYFVRVKLRQYSRLERDYKDKYSHNQFVFQKTVDHSAALTYAIISKQARYVDFIDQTNTLEESLVFQEKPGEQALIIMEDRFNSDQTQWINRTNFLGLDMVEPIAKAVFDKVFAQNEAP